MFHLSALFRILQHNVILFLPCFFLSPCHASNYFPVMFPIPSRHVPYFTTLVFLSLAVIFISTHCHVSHATLSCHATVSCFPCHTVLFPMNPCHVFHATLTCFSPLPLFEEQQVRALHNSEHGMASQFWPYTQINFLVDIAPTRNSD